jgi:hypothetical protein
MFSTLKRTALQSRCGYLLGALALGGFVCLAGGCETTTTHKGFSSGYNYHKPGRDSRSGPLPMADPETVASRGESPSTPYDPGPELPADVTKGIADLFDLITPPAAGQPEQKAVNKGMIPNNYTGPHEIKDKNGNTIRVTFDRGRIIKKEIIPEGSDKPISDAPKVFRSEQPRP